MKEEKLQTITSLFEGKKIRGIWDSTREEYYLVSWMSFRH